MSFIDFKKTSPKNEDIEEELKLLATNIEILNQKIGETPSGSSSSNFSLEDNDNIMVEFSTINKKLDKMMGFLLKKIPSNANNNDNKNNDSGEAENYLEIQKIVKYIEKLAEMNKLVFHKNIEMQKQLQNDIKNYFGSEIAKVNKTLLEMDKKTTIVGKELLQMKKFLINKK